MEKYLEKLVGKKIGVTRMGAPKEVFFEAKLKAVEDGVAVFDLENGQEAAVPVDKILLVGGPGEDKGEEKGKVGFMARGGK